MQTSDQPRPLNYAPWVTASIIGFVFCGVVIWFIVGVTGFFRLSSETAALRASFISSVPGAWDKKLALHVGWFTTGAVRAGSRLFNLPPEPRAALDALRGAEVGIYRLAEREANFNGPTVFHAMDRAMKSRGWDRIVGVAEKGQLVAVYWPERKVSAGSIKCCVLVFEDKQLIVSSVRGNVRPLLRLAGEHMKLPDFRRQLALGT